MLSNFQKMNDKKLTRRRKRIIESIYSVHRKKYNVSSLLKMATKFYLVILKNDSKTITLLSALYPTKL